MSVTVKEWPVVGNPECQIEDKACARGWPSYRQVNVSRDHNIGSSEMSILEGGALFFPSPTFSLGNAMAETTTGKEPVCVINKPWFPSLAMPSQHNSLFFDNQVTGVYQSG